jgi:hypothetical protein
MKSVPIIIGIVEMWYIEPVEMILIAIKIKTHKHIKHMKQIIIIFSCLAFFWSCSKNKQEMFSEENTAISFFHGGSININFLFYPETQNEVKLKIPLHLSGTAQNRDRYYSVSIVKEGENKTTAKEGIHYNKLKDKYLFRQGLYQDSMLVVLKKDESLKNKVYKLTFKLKDTIDFKLGLNEDGDIEDYYRHQIIIEINSNLDVPPNFWKFYAANDNFLSKSEVGPYHPLKCQKFIEIAGIKDENWRYKNLIDMLIYIRKTKKWFRENVRIDENGNRLYFEQR